MAADKKAGCFTWFRGVWVQLKKRPGRGVEGLVTGYGPESLVNETSLMEEIIKRENLIAAWKKVKENGGAAGIDGMTVKELK